MADLIKMNGFNLFFDNPDSAISTQINSAEGLYKHINVYDENQNKLTGFFVETGKEDNLEQISKFINESFLSNQENLDKFKEETKEENLIEENIFDEGLNMVNDMEEKTQDLNIKVRLRDNPNKEESNLKAFASVEIGGVTINNVRVVERESKFDQSKYIDFNMPSVAREVDGEKKYTNLAEISSKDENRTKEITKEIRKAINEAYKSENVDERGYKTAENQTNIKADMSYTNVYTSPVSTEKSPGLQAFATAYVGNTIKLNNLTLREGENRETGEKFQTINFPQNQDKEGKYHPITFADEGIRNAIKDKAIEDYKVREDVKAAEVSSPIEENTQDFGEAEL